MSPKIPARVFAIAQKVGDDPLAWKEHPDGSVVIVFCNKGKLTFLNDFSAEIEPDFPAVIHTNEEAAEVVKTLTPSHKPTPKRKEK